MAKKIFVDKKDSVEAVIKKFLSDPAVDIALVIPREASLKESINNFRLIKKEADKANKTIIIESVDEDTLAMARSSNLEGAHPLFRSTPGRSALQDIVVSHKKKETISPKAYYVHQEEHVDTVIVPIEEESEWEGEPEQEEKQIIHGIEDKPVRIRTVNIKKHSRLTIAVLLPFLAIAGALWLVVALWGSADVTLTLKKTPWTYHDTLMVDKTIASAGATQVSIPGELFTQQKNFTQLFPATKKEQVSKKATGKIEIYNAYGTQTQTLVATTRFTTADGKIYRLTDRVVVPGAKMVGGVLTPTSIEASVIADAPGVDYNLATQEQLNIPGFKGSPRYGKFYGMLISASGGYIGEKMVPSEADITAAKQKLSDILKNSLTNAFFNNRPRDFVIPDGASDIVITKLSVNQNTDEEGNFIVFGEAIMKAIAFRENDVRALLESVANKELAQGADSSRLVFHDLRLSYDQTKLNFDQGKLQIDVTGDGSLQPVFEQDEFRSQILGRSIQDARALIINTSVIADAHISLWPFWLKWFSSIPKDPARVNVIVE